MPTKKKVIVADFCESPYRDVVGTWGKRTNTAR